MINEKKIQNNADIKPDAIKNKAKSKVKSKLVLRILVISLVAVIILAVSGTQVYLYANLLLGNDLNVGTRADKENLFLSNGQSYNISFESHISANPFCTSQCSSAFTDLSSGNISDVGLLLRGTR